MVTRGTEFDNLARKLGEDEKCAIWASQRSEHSRQLWKRVGLVGNFRFSSKRSSSGYNLKRKGFCLS